jgi:hypothetical protein
MLTQQELCLECSCQGHWAHRRFRGSNREHDWFGETGMRVVSLNHWIRT